LAVPAAVMLIERFAVPDWLAESVTWTVKL
jgi:hypothetical protein